MESYKLMWVQEGVLFNALVYIVYRRGMSYFFSSFNVYIHKGYYNFEPNVNVQKRAIGFGENTDNWYASFIKFHWCHMVILLNDYIVCSFAFWFKDSQIGDSWSSHGLLWVLQFWMVVNFLSLVVRYNHSFPFYRWKNIQHLTLSS